MPGFEDVIAMTFWPSTVDSAPFVIVPLVLSSPKSFPMSVSGVNEAKLPVADGAAIHFPARSCAAAAPAYWR